jgi:hypothetical protein
MLKPIEANGKQRCTQYYHERAYEALDIGQDDGDEIHQVEQVLRYPHLMLQQTIEEVVSKKNKITGRG